MRSVPVRRSKTDVVVRARLPGRTGESGDQVQCDRDVRTRQVWAATAARTARSSERLQADGRSGRRSSGVPCRRAPGPPGRAARPTRRVQDGEGGPDDERGLPVGVAGPDDLLVRRQRCSGRGGVRRGGGVSRAGRRRRRPPAPGSPPARRRGRRPARGRRRRGRTAARSPRASATASISTCRNSRRASGSRLATGSSSTSSSGRLARPSVSASWARCPPESWPARCRGIQPQLADPAAAQPRVPARVEPGAEPQMLGDRQRRHTSGCPGRRTRPWPAGAGPRQGVPRSTSILPDEGASSPRPSRAGSSCRRRWGRPGRVTRPAGISACSPAAPTGAGSAYPRPWRRSDDAHATSSVSAARKLSRRAPRCSRRPGPPPAPWRASAAGRAAAARARPTTERPASWSRTCRPLAGRRRAALLELPIGLEDRVRIDRQARHTTSFTVGSWSPSTQQAQPHRTAVPDDDLEVRERRPTGRPA